MEIYGNKKLQLPTLKLDDNLSIVWLKALDVKYITEINGCLFVLWIIVGRIVTCREWKVLYVPVLKLSIGNVC